MARGKHSASVAKSLRDEIQALRQNVKLLQAKLAAAERERDALAAWKSDAMSNGSPEVRAVTARLEAKVALEQAAHAKTQEKWASLIDDVRFSMRQLWRIARESKSDIGVYTDRSMEAFAEMFGEDFAAGVANIDNRETRRNSRTRGQFKGARSRYKTTFADGEIEP